MKKELICISDLNHGDTVLIDGDMRTLSRNDIKTSGNLGARVFGKRFTNGIERVLFPKFYKGSLVGYFSQI